MSASLVGSEMCIRDRSPSAPSGCQPARRLPWGTGRAESAAQRSALHSHLHVHACGHFRVAMHAAQVAS
eukprot:9228644-Alexandrium_andersonii.AAC.1